MRAEFRGDALADELLELQMTNMTEVQAGLVREVIAELRRLRTPRVVHGAAVQAKCPRCEQIEALFKVDGLGAKAAEEMCQALSAAQAVLKRMSR